MMKEVRAFKASDGKLFENYTDCARHEIILHAKAIADTCDVLECRDCQMFDSVECRCNLTGADCSDRYDMTGQPRSWYFNPEV